jgi:hypothetical protein
MNPSTSLIAPLPKALQQYPWPTGLSIDTEGVVKTIQDWLDNNKPDIPEDIQNIMLVSYSLS